MSSIQELLLKFRENITNTLDARSAKFLKTDLHVHTLISHDVRTILSVEEYADELIRKAKESGIEVLALTDHNDIQSFDIFLRSAEEYGVFLLAGVEINIPKSHVDPSRSSYIHVIAIHENPDRIVSILRAVNIEADTNPETAIAITNPLGLVPVLKIILDKGGIPILAHSSSTRGFGNEFRASYRTAISEHLKELPFFVEIAHEEEAQYFDGTDPDLQHIDVPCLFNSDCHTIDESSADSRKLGSRFSYLKMQKPSFDNLAKVLREPKLRVTRSDPTPPPLPRILGLAVSGSYFEDLEVPLHPNLNVIVGGRGTGKSTLVSMIQFGFNVSPITEGGTKEHESKIKDLLGEGNSVMLAFYGNDNNTYVLKRTYIEGGDNASQTKLWQISEVNQVIPLSTDNISNLALIEIYRQGELVEISKEVINQLKLIDGYIEDSGIFDQRENIREQILKASKTIDALWAEKISLEDEISKKDDIENRIRELSRLVEYDFVRNYQIWQKEYRFIEATHSYLQEVNRGIGNFEYPTLPQFEAEDSTIKETITQLLEVNQEIKIWLKNRMYEISNDFSFNHLHINALALITKWEEQYRQAEQDFRTNISEVRLDVEAILDMLESKKQEYAIITKKHIPKSQEITQEINGVQNFINQKISELILQDQTINQERIEVAAYLSDKLDGIQVEFQGNRNFSLIIDELSKRFRGRPFNLRKKEGKFAALFANLNHPLELFQWLGEKEKYEIMEDISRDKKLINFLQEYRYDTGFLDALTLEAPFSPVIKFEKSPGQYKILEELSLGEKCGAILSIILLQKGEPRILIIDTPESEMDHHHFISQVVATMAKAKIQRQLIFVTHNPNIPVLADAELIIETESSGIEKGRIKNLGYLDDEDILNSILSLEGGKEAFQRRSRRYGFSLS